MMLAGMVGPFDEPNVAVETTCHSSALRQRLPKATTSGANDRLVFSLRGSAREGPFPSTAETTSRKCKKAIARGCGTGNRRRVVLMAPVRLLSPAGLLPGLGLLPEPGHCL